MSKSRPDLDNSIEKTREIVAYLSRLSPIVSIHIAGSRSPLKTKEPREDSDWDLIAIRTNPVYHVPSLRQNKGYHGDLLLLNPDQHMGHYKAVEIWPTDEYGILV